MTNMFFLSQYILNPTRKENILDLFFTNNNDAVLHAEIKDTKISDHSIVEIINRQTLLTFDRLASTLEISDRATMSIDLPR